MTCPHSPLSAFRPGPSRLAAAPAARPPFQVASRAALSQPGSPPCPIIKDRVQPFDELADELITIGMSRALRGLSDTELNDPFNRALAYHAAGLAADAQADAMLARLDARALASARLDPHRNRSHAA